MCHHRIDGRVTAEELEELHEEDPEHEEPEPVEAPAPTDDD